jgi:general secretion pathway protein A
VPVSKARKLWYLQNFLLSSRDQGKVNVLIVDEAHKLSYELLEEIRLLGNIEYMDEKLIQILLLGQRELDDLLNRADLWQLKQRISVRLTLQALSAGEVEAYVQHRWTVAGGAAHPFTPEAIAVLRKGSGGVPRLINSICENALTQSFADGGRLVEARHMELALADLRLNDQPPPPVAAVPMAVPPPPVKTTPVAPPLHAVRESQDVAEAPKPLPVTAPLNGHTPASSTLLKGFDAYSRKRGFWSRWAERLGLSSEING